MGAHTTLIPFYHNPTNSCLFLSVYRELLLGHLGQESGVSG
ncbi:hypothetical protein PRUPE_1G016200 [Prunus persica]|uniref:Uncharacterized protein n=1 Tax=Prunus persica TaxID=3760 RepID=A0A251QRB0_PRUPE|nr:hypothetical protein PRUPE_1G016200 [Prunus persica]